jgi:Amt family ammonium transporter
MTKGCLLCLFVLKNILSASCVDVDVDVLRKLTELEGAVRKLEAQNLLITAENQKLEADNVQMHTESARIHDENVALKEAFEQETGRRLQTGFIQVNTANIATNAASIATNTASITANEASITANAAAIADIQAAMDTLWVLLCGCLIMLMQAGFAMVESGTCRVKNVQNILLKNMVDVCVGTMCWFAFGWTIAYGFDADDKDQVFAGNLQYFGHEFLEADKDGNQVATDAPRDWFFQWTFCATGATIVSGGVAERVQFPGYLIFTVCMTCYIYPTVVAWMWSTNGWLTAGKDNHLNEVGFNDFAGSGIVHMTGGIAALIGAIATGPRKGRFDSNAGQEFDPHNLPFIVLGTFILWFGWYGFNCGSTLGLSSAEAGKLAAVVAMNTTLAASIGGIIVLVLRKILLRRYDVGGMCNGILAGLVSITAGCGNVECGSALVIGAIGGIIFEGASRLLKLIKVDDPIDAFAVHGACGFWGVLAAALFDWGAGFDKYNGFNGGFGNAEDLSDPPNKDNLWKSGFAAAIVEVLVIIAWVGGNSAIIFFPLRLAGFLRVADDVQDQGMDEAKHSPSKAYAGSYGENGVI